jgi:death-on-curing protein
MSDLVWIDARALELLHNESIVHHGGILGFRDVGAYESALMRPQNLFAYEGVKYVPQIAASYAFGLAKNHPFSDGNKRAAFEAVGLFLLLNGLRLTANAEDAARTMYALASSEMSEDEFAVWIGANCRAV